MQNPFDDENARFHVVTNDQGQHALWPVFADVPEGWQAVLSDQSRQSCLEYIEQNWVDIRPNGLTRD